MRRPSFLSTLTLVGLAAAMATSFAVGLRAIQQDIHSNHCLDGCGKGKKPPGCCEPPPCEYEYELKVNAAKVRSFHLTQKQTKRGPGQSQYVYTGPGADKIAAAVSQFSGGMVDLKTPNSVKEDALKTLAKDFTDCAAAKPFIEKEPFYVDVDSGKCTLSQKNAKGDRVEIDRNDPKALENAKDAAPECREAVEADWHRAATLQDICKKNGGSLNAATLPDAQRQAAEAAQQSMREQLSQFLDSCKPFIKNPKVKEAVNKAQQLLKDTGGKYIPQNKRTLSGRSKSQSGRGGRG